MSGCHKEISCNTELSTPHPAVLYWLNIGKVETVYFEHGFRIHFLKLVYFEHGFRTL